MWLTRLTRQLRPQTQRSRPGRTRRSEARPRRLVRPRLEVLEERALPSVVGYVNDWNNGTNEARMIQAAGDTAVQLTDADLTPSNLAGLDALVIELAPPPTGRSATLLANWGNVLNYVNQGGRLVLHDADPGANAMQPVVPGLSASTFVQAGSQFMSVADPNSPIINGPFGTINDHSFDWGTYSSHGYVDASTLPSFVHVVMVNRDSQFGMNLTNQATVLTYHYGSGNVVYDTVPAAYYLQYYDDTGWPIGVAINREFLPNELNEVLTAPRLPTPNAGGPYVISEGNGLTLSAGGTLNPDNVPLTYAWNVNGVAGAATGVSPTLSWSQLQALGIQDEGTFNVTVQVNDGRGNMVTATTTLTVNHVAPTVNAGPNAITNEGSPFTGSGSFTAPGADVWTATVDYGDGTGAQALALNPDKTFNLSHVYAVNGNYTVTVVVTDDDGGAGTSQLRVTVNNVPPTVNPGLNATVNEGGTFTSTGLFADPGKDTWTATVDYGDGSGVQNLTLNADKTFNLSHAYADEGSYTVTVIVTEGNGASGTGTLTVTVNNVAPVVNLGPGATINEGGTFTDSGSFVDPGADVWTATVDYGDGSGAQALTLNADKTFALNHLYGHAGTYSVTTSVKDDDGTVGTSTLTVTVNNLPPTITLGPAGSVSEGTTFAGSGSFSDPGAEIWTATVDYGDGSGPQSLTLNADKTFALRHLYADEGNYTVTVHVTDDGGLVGTSQLTVTVNDVAPAVSAIPAAAINEGGTFAGAGSFTDPAADAWTATVDYGDGSGAQALTLNADKTFALSHAYGRSGTFTVTVTIKDDDGSVGTSSAAVTVNNVTPVVSLGNDPTINQGQALTATGSFTDPGSETWTATVNYGDGSGAQALTLNADKTFALSHVYNAAGNFTVTVTVTDQDGASGSTTLPVNVLAVNVAPVVSVAGPALGARGQPLTYTFFASTSAAVAGAGTGGPAGSFTYAIQWGDGSAVQTVAATPGNGAGVALDHVFRHVGTFTIHVTATDAAGGSGSATYQVVIRPVALENDPYSPGLTELVVGGTLGNDVILLHAGRRKGQVRVEVNGKDLGTYAPTGRLVVYGQAGDDFIWVSHRLQQPAWLFGGSGNDVLIGGGGDSVLVGGPGNNVLVGRGHRDLLIGGSGQDVLIAQGGQDVLIGGSTVFDHNEAALNAIMSEWSSSRPRKERIANLEGKGHGPRLNGDVFLTWRGPNPTVHRSHHHDWVFGRPGRDWIVPSLDG